jgi:ornithine cyclodeaminase/alanine dehydrogenase
MTQTSTIPHLSEQDLASLNIGAAEIVDILECLLRDAAKGQVWAAPKAVIQPPDGRYVMATLAVMSNPPLVATKSLVLNARNSEIGLPQINSLVTLLNGDTGQPLATLDGNWITAIRTAGLSALAAKYMANPAAETIGFIGTGTQARSHLQLFSEMFPLTHLKALGRGEANLARLETAAADRDLTAERCETAEDVVKGADIIISSLTHTSIGAPFLDADWMSNGAFAVSVDLGVPWHRDSFSALDHVIIDDLEQEAALPNKLVNPEDTRGDLSGLVLGTATGRKAPADRTAFVFRGHAIGDLALAALAYQTFREAG